MPEDFGRDLYGGDEPSSQERTTPEHEDKEHEEGKTAVINSDICPDLKPGDELRLRVVESREGEYVVEYEAEPEKEKGGEGEEAPMPGGGDHEMASMME